LINISGKVGAGRVVKNILSGGVRDSRIRSGIETPRGRGLITKGKRIREREGKKV